MTQLTYDDLEDLLVEKENCINRLREVGKNFRHGWSNDELPYSQISVARRDLDDEMKSIMEAYK